MPPDSQRLLYFTNDLKHKKQDSKNDKKQKKGKDAKITNRVGEKRDQNKNNLTGNVFKIKLIRKEVL